MLEYVETFNTYIVCLDTENNIYKIYDRNRHFICDAFSIDDYHEIIQGLSLDNNHNPKSNFTLNLYDLFVSYCNKMTNKFFIDNKLATTNEKLLRRFIGSFEKKFSAKVVYECRYDRDEYFYVVTNVIAN